MLYWVENSHPPDVRVLHWGLAVMDQQNNVKKIREAKMLSRAELARLAGISPLTLQRIEMGKECRMATKRKILLALGLTIEQKHTLFKQ